MVYSFDNRLLNIFHRTLCILSIKLWYILVLIGISIIVIILALIPIYLINSNSQINNQIKQKSGVYNNIFRIRWLNASPDSYQRSLLSINNQIVAPTIIVNEGDLINITIINQLSEPTTIHWHGLYQHNTNHMDGVPGVTQCSILPNETFLYQYSTINQSGTYWYHSHSVMQYGDGLKGILIIQNRNDPFKHLYDDEDILQLTDWYHLPLNILLKTYLYPGTIDPLPDTLLINGIGQFNCTRFNQTCSYYRSFIRWNQTKRYRIINTSVYATITLTIDQHQMRLIEVDGIYLDGNLYLQTLRLNPGQRYSFLITAAQPNLHSQTYWIRATIHPFASYNQQFFSAIQPDVGAILEYVNDNNNHKTIPSLNSFHNTQFILNQSINIGKRFSDELGLIPMNISEYQVPRSKSIQTLIYNSQFKGKNPGYMYFNNETFIHPMNITLLSLIVYNYSNQILWPLTIELENNQIIDIIINNIDYAPHPFHLHGHHVWILSQGYTNDGYLNQSTFTNMIYNEHNPLYRDTFTVNPYSYIIVRFQTNNPGIWMLHCHNDWHLQIGMSLVFIESSQLIHDYYHQNNFTHLISTKCTHY